ncbi:hypothetical protein E3_0600 [Rhodococcus phage E3]|uniref:hypothetical protein n=1 Tax=Rhodococcus phage E3 TaxID=1007869 RepID=UPI0002C6B819|nr:hypothetical protein M176_gp064 [Rhodococcus phage E3]AEQ20974.1 hypothetical protein E3_0600 [Rhodococcus phage E3]
MSRLTDDQVQQRLADAKRQYSAATTFLDRRSGRDLVEAWEDVVAVRAGQPISSDRIPDEDASVTDGHELIVSYGDCELHGRCQCGTYFGFIKPNGSLDKLGEKWERHVMLEARR